MPNTPSTFLAGLRRHSLVTFFVIAFASAWLLVLLTRFSLAFAFLGLFGPAAAAIIVTALADGRAGIRKLIGRVTIWRVGIIWYAVALGLPLLLSLAVVGLSIARGEPTEIQFAGASPLSPLLFLLAIGEELGWRGFALPRLQERFSGLGASLLLGLLWAAWHLPNQFIPGLEAYGYGFPAFASYVVAMTILFTWLAKHSRGSVLLAWFFHGAINTLIVVNAAIGLVERWWLSAFVYGAAALLVVLAEGRFPPSFHPSEDATPPATPLR